MKTLDQFITPKNTIKSTPSNEIELSSTESGTDVIEIAEELSSELFDSEAMAKTKSKKRKYNVIAEDESEENQNTGEAMSGVLAEQNIPDTVYKTML